MDKDTIKMEDHPEHWKATLLGDEFWKDAENFNKSINDSIEADDSKLLHTRFPFNLEAKPTPQAILATTESTTEAPKSNQPTDDTIDANDNKSLLTKFPFNIGVEQLPRDEPAATVSTDEVPGTLDQSASDDKPLSMRFPFNIGIEQSPRTIAIIAESADEVSGNNKAPEKSKVPENTEVPGKGEVPEKDEVPENTEVPKNTKVSEEVKVPEKNEVPEKGEKPGKDEIPDKSEISEKDEGTNRNEMHQVNEGPKKMPHRRHFSTSDATSMKSSPPRARSPFHRSSTRAFDFIKRGRSQSQSRSSSVATDIHRLAPLLRTPFNKLGCKKNGEEDTEQNIPQPTFVPADQATPAKPYMDFRGGTTWEYLPKNRRTLGLDVFWPVDEEEEQPEKEMLHIRELEPLCEFRNLHVLKITGMAQSYQKCIWQAAWLNTNLEELEIGMALQPRLRCNGKKWPYIKGGWTLDKANYSEPVYYGCPSSSGALDYTIGVGEYLDKIVIEKAKICALAMGRTRNRLSIRRLVLTGFVVDADPFLHWFDPKRLKCINFKDYCVDAGFYLSLPMKKVTVIFPREVEESPLVARSLSLPSELKIVDFKRGRKIGEIPYRGPDSLKEDIPRNVDVKKDTVERGAGEKDIEGRENEEKDDEKDDGKKDDSEKNNGEKSDDMKTDDVKKNDDMTDDNKKEAAETSDKEDSKEMQNP